MTGELSGTILVVDDNPASLYATSRVLRHAGFAVHSADTGMAAIALATQQQIDLIVLDIDLPDLDGYEVCRMIRASPSPSQVRVVHLSATFVHDVDKVKGYEAGADGFLTHPVEPTVLVATVKALLRTRAVELQLAQLLERERTSRQEAEKANRVKDEFLATLSHELRSPVNAIVGWAEVARLHKPSPEVVHALDVIVRNARFQTQLISDLLDVSRITAGKFQLDLQPVVLADAVEAAVDTVRSSAVQRQVTIATTIDRSIGVVEGDPVRLQQIAGNLLNNAVKFSEPGHTVTLSLRREGDEATLEVVDTGRGIEAALLDQIFERFWQDDTSSRRSHSGLGLGLAIVKHLSEMHRGRVSVRSDGLGKGAIFTVTIPIALASVRTVTPGLAVRGLGVAQDLTGLRVLIVDDDEDGRQWVRHIVVDAGAEALDVGDVGKALDAVESFTPHVLVSDLAMPNRDGFDLLGLLRARGHTPESLPSIALSAFASAEHRDRAFEATFQSFLSKPPDPRELIAVVAMLGARRRQRSVETPPA
ncbi:MAG: response regulator [Gemmatimonadaceae bacterium]